MKRKNYITPAIKVKKIVPHKILAGSPQVVSGDATPSTETQDGTGNGGDGLAKGGFFNLDAPVPTYTDYSGDSGY